MNVVVALLILSMIGALIQRTTGFGFGIFMMTMLPTLMPSYGEATALSGLLSVSMSVFVAWRLRRYIQWRNLWVMLIAFTITSTIAIFALKGMDNHTLQLALGIVLIILSLYFLIVSGKINLPPTIATQIGAGSVSGVMGGLFGMHGAPASIYFVSTEKSKERYMAISQMYFTIGNILMSLVRWHNGFFTETVFVDYLYGIGGVIIGTQLGRLIFRHISIRILRTIVYIYVGISGVVILLTM